MSNREYRWFQGKLKGPDLKPRNYVFRGATQGEWNAASSRSNPYDFEMYILNKCVKDFQGEIELEGTSRKLFETITALSGKDGTDNLLNEASAWLLSDEGKYEAAAITVISGLNPEYFRSCDPSDRMKLLLLGKILFEQFIGTSVEEAFVEKQPVGNGLDDVELLPADYRPGLD